MMIKVKIGKEVIECREGTKVSEILKDPDVLACKVNGKLEDLSLALTQDSEIVPLRFDSEEGKKVFWHSSAHLLAQAVKELYPEAKLGTGPPTDNGFYYDFDIEKPFTKEDLKKIEDKMREISALDLPIQKDITSSQNITSFFQEKGEDYKVEILSELQDKEVSIYTQGDFTDLCTGPHIPRTGLIKGIKLLSVAGAYWKGDERNKMLQRIYGISFPTQEELDAFLQRLEEAKKRDHRILGPELGIFSLSEEAGPGLVFWHPKGNILREIIEDYWKRRHTAQGYMIVHTPHIARGEVFKTSGHYDYYKEKMYVIKNGEEYVLRPMNCPFHILLYKSTLHSYRDLPLRFAELGTVYRREKSGELHGTLRVRGFTQDDGHIFCTPQQVEKEIEGIVDLALSMLHTFGFYNLLIELSLRDPNEKEEYLGSDEEWEEAERILKKVLKEKGLKFQSKEGEAVFYGPKIDIHLLDALNRKWQATTIQFDFNLPKRFDITYVGEDGERHPVVLIHRAILGSLERFVGALIEHYGGSFPLWLSPYQVKVLTITDKEIDYAKEITSQLLKAQIRTVTDFRNEKIAYKIAEAEREKIPYMLIIGKKEKENRTVSLRRHRQGDLGEKELSEVIRSLKEEIYRRG